jgi:hypothetical protein
MGATETYTWRLQTLITLIIITVADLSFLLDVALMYWRPTLVLASPLHGMRDLNFPLPSVDGAASFQ